MLRLHAARCELMQSTVPPSSKIEDAAHQAEIWA